MDPKVKKIVSQIKKKYKPEKIILFGSHARGDTHEGSDVDLLLIKETDKKFTKRTEEVLTQIDYDIDLDVLVYTEKEIEKMLSEKNPFMEKAWKEGVAV